MFYVFEGMDGVGKTTQIRRLREALQERRGLEVEVVREPGGTRLGERLREVLLDPATGELSASVEAFLFLAARAHLFRTRIRPALDAGRGVIADRFHWSTVVYQGIAAGLDPELWLSLSAIATDSIRPSRIFLLDMDPDLAIARLGPRDRMEGRASGDWRRVREGYLELARRFPEGVEIVDASGSADEVHREIVGRLEGGEEWDE